MRARWSSPEPAALLTAGLLSLAAASQVALPLVIFAVLTALLALPMSAVIAWLSRGESLPQDGDDGGEPVAEGDAWQASGAAGPWRTEPLPRPTRPPAPGDAPEQARGRVA